MNNKKISLDLMYFHLEFFNLILGLPAVNFLQEKEHLYKIPKFQFPWLQWKLSHKRVTVAETR